MGRGTLESPWPTAARHQCSFSTAPKLPQYLDTEASLSACHFHGITVYSAWTPGTREEQGQAMFIILVWLSLRAEKSDSKLALTIPSSFGESVVRENVSQDQLFKLYEVLKEQN